MKIVAGSDWRDAIPFESPMLVAEVVPGDPTRCFTCGPDSELRPRTELWVVKHKHPKNHAGFVRFYCAEHRPAFQRPAPVVETRPGRAAPRAARQPSTRQPAVRRPTPSDERPKALCPDCYVEVPATGICGMCGNTVA
ncbi:glucose-6-phosphate dehydrogenase [Microbacterium terricola]|uniref:Glucose-6-phosphate dehydrogenase n=1 Tax=Microbacterium terricola TaxID=344163 RepID=A0ABM8DZU8_9MICO|nr:glucose-6-phosphate dehydrogenase [Microbacterium terricola]UYK41187.1 glucose-6-phosphate dehydrogenase [Microbacterium terricola]BDV31041.1 hypothetical protein Microterr_17010 [Microbacterium terricola]